MIEYAVLVHPIDAADDLDVGIKDQVLALNTGEEDFNLVVGGTAAPYVSGVQVVGAVRPFIDFKNVNGIRRSDSITSGTASQINCIAYGAGLYVAGFGGVIYTSPDLVTWTLRARGSSENRPINFIFWSGTQFLLCTDSGGTFEIWSSPDGVTWTGRSNLNQACNCVAWNGSVFVAVFAAGIIRTSSDGATWTTRQFAVGGANYSVVWTGSRFVTVGDFSSAGSTEWSTDGISWNRVASGFSQTMFSVVVINGVVVAAGNSGRIIRSLDNGLTYSDCVSNTTSSLRLFVANGTLMAVGASGVCIQSNSNGAGWSPAVSSGVATFLRYGVPDPANPRNALIVGDSGVIRRAQYGFRAINFASESHRASVPVPQSWWSFDANKVSGTSVTDIGGFLMAGTLVGSPTFSSGKIGRAVSFNGTSQYMSLPDARASWSARTQKSITAWVKTNHTGTDLRMVFRFPRSNTAAAFSLSQNNGFWVGVHGSGVTLTSPSAVTSNWTHLALVQDSNTLSLYVNGTLAASSAIAGTGVATYETMTAVATAGAAHFPLSSPPVFQALFDGLINSVRMYDKSLTAGEISAMFSSENAGNHYVPVSALWLAYADTNNNLNMDTDF